MDRAQHNTTHVACFIGRRPPQSQPQHSYKLHPAISCGFAVCGNSRSIVRSLNDRRPDANQQKKREKESEHVHTAILHGADCATIARIIKRTHSHDDVSPRCRGRKATKRKTLLRRVAHKKRRGEQRMRAVCAKVAHHLPIRGAYSHEMRDIISYYCAAQ